MMRLYFLLFFIFIASQPCFAQAQADTTEIIIHAPNAFTPNNYGPEENHTYRPVVLNAEQFLMVIRNRDGAIVFETDNPDVGWDGKYRGEYLTEGVYAVFIYARRGGKEVIRKLNVTLLR